MINATTLNQDGTGDLACIRRGNFHSTAASQAGRITRTNTAILRWYADDAGVVLTGTGSVPDIRNSIFRTLLTKDNTGGDVRVHSLMGQLKAYDAKWNDEVVSAVHGRLELVRSTSTMTLGGNGITAAVLGVPSVSGAVTVNTSHYLSGVAAVSDFRATLTQTGVVTAFLAAAYDTTNWSDSTARTTWGYGLYIANSAATTGVYVGTCTTGINEGGTITTGLSQSGTLTTGILQGGTIGTGISQTGTFSSHGINLGGAYSGHAIYYPATASLATNKRILRFGDYGTEIPVVGGQGIIRTYCKVNSGTGATALQFHWGFTENTSSPIGSQMQIESQAGTPGPTGICGHDFLVGIASTKYLAASATEGDGLRATWHKVYASADSVCNGDVYPVWIDHQMSCAVAGTEASIRVSTGGTRPNAFVWFHTTSSGLDNLLYFDSTMASAAPLGSGSLKDSDGTNIKCDKYLINDINGTPYYIPLYDTLN